MDILCSRVQFILLPPPPPPSPLPDQVFSQSRSHIFGDHFNHFFLGQTERKKERGGGNWQACSKVPVIFSQFRERKFKLIFFYGGYCVESWK